MRSAVHAGASISRTWTLTAGRAHAFAPASARHARATRVGPVRSCSTAAPPTATAPASASRGSPRRLRVWLRRALYACLGLGVLLPAAKVYLALRPLWDPSLDDTDVLTIDADTASAWASEPLPGRVKWYAWLMSAALDRLTRDVYVAARIVAEYYTARADDDAWARAHVNAAQLLLRLCRVNRGIYIKLGQHVGQLDYLLPEAYVTTLRVMTHAAPTDSTDTVMRVIAQELALSGKRIEDVFERIEPTPIASASLAQVHVAYLKGSNEKVAVKVQHAGLRETSTADITTVAFLVRAVKAMFPRFDYQWLADEIQDNLPKELDFRQEADNCEACSLLFAHRPNIVAPKVYRDLTTTRMLTMSFEDGVYVNNVKAIREMGIATADVARLVSEAFNEQIFVHGRCHCDPHAANLLVRRHGASNKPQLVLLDHGLYRTIPHELRVNYAKLWKAILFGDEAGIKKYSERMNAGDMYQLWASMLTTRSWDKILAAPDDLSRLQLTGNAADKAETASYAKEYANEITVVLRKIPRELLLILKTNDCLRSVDFALGNPVNNMVIMARYTAEALRRERQDARPGWGSWWRSQVESWNFELRMAAFSWYMSWRTPRRG